MLNIYKFKKVKDNWIKINDYAKSTFPEPCESVIGFNAAFNVCDSMRVGEFFHDGGIWQAVREDYNYPISISHWQPMPEFPKNWKQENDMCCEWKEETEYEHYTTNCGEKQYFSNGSIKDNKYKYCPYCNRTIKEIKLITVCKECLRACCWQGEFMCEKAKFADAIEKSTDELEKLNLESSDWWK